MESTPVNKGEQEQGQTQLQAAAPACGVSPRVLWRKTEALERLGGDEELFRELCEIFLAESPRLLLKLRQAIAGSDEDTVMREAHSLKGELGYLGASVACEASQKLEDMGRGKNLSQAAEVFTMLERELSDLHVVIKDSAGVPR